MKIIYKDFRAPTGGNIRKEKMQEYWEYIKAEKVQIKKDFVSEFTTCGVKKVPGTKFKYPRFVRLKKLDKLMDLEKIKDWDLKLKTHEKDLRELSNKEFLPYVKNCFGEYLDECKRTRCMVLGEHLDTGEWHGFEVFNRFTDQSKKELMSKFGLINSFGIKDGVDYDKSVFLTNTYDPSKISLVDAWKNLPGDWNRFKTHLRQVVDLGYVNYRLVAKALTKLKIIKDLALQDKLGSVGEDWKAVRPELVRIRGTRENVDYAMTVEAQANGYPHIHSAIFGVDRLLWNGNWKEYQNLKPRNKKKSIQGMWKRGFTYVNKTDGGREIRVPLNYMLKCMSNTWGERGPRSKGYLTQSLLWFFNRNSYNCGKTTSKYLTKAVQDKEREDLDGNSYKPSEIKWRGLVIVVGREDIQSNLDLCEYLEQNGEVITGRDQVRDYG